MRTVSVNFLSELQHMYVETSSTNQRVYYYIDSRFDYVMCMIHSTVVIVLSVLFVNRSRPSHMIKVVDTNT